MTHKNFPMLLRKNARIDELSDLKNQLKNYIFF